MIIANEYDHAGVKIKIVLDEDPISPRGDTNLGVMFCWHPDYELGDEQFGRPRDELQFHSMHDVVTYLRDERQALVILPLFLYDHSGITIRAGEPILGDPESNTAQERMKAAGRFMGDDRGWDTSHVGFIYTNQEKLDETGAPPEDAIKQLRAEVEEYADYLEGNVYGYIVGEGTPFEDSCWGFIGSEDGKPYVEQEAESVAEYVAEKIERESEEAAEWAARDTITID